MSDPVEKLKAVLDVQTDIALAAMLGLERSTIAQWRRRGSVPVRYRTFLDPKYPEDAREILKTGDRRLVYGDGPGEMLMRAALAAVPLSELEGENLSPEMLGHHREGMLINIVALAIDLCSEVLGKPRVESEGEYSWLVTELLDPSNAERLADAMNKPTLWQFY